MKQLKKMLCVLLAAIMVLTTVTIGVSAAPANLSKPGGTDIHGENILTTAQRATLLLNYIDQILLKQNMNYNIDLVVASVNLDLRSIDRALDSICNLIDSDLFDKVKGLIGELKNINTFFIKNTRRSTGGIGDIEVLYDIIRFAWTPSNLLIIYHYLRDELDMGTAGNFVSLPSLGLDKTIRDALYNAMIDENAPTATMYADDILQTFVNRIFLGGKDQTGAYQEGYLPSMSGKTNIFGYSLYQFVENAANAAMADYIMPDINTKFKRQIKEIFGYTFENDEDMVGDDSNVDPRLKELINFDYTFTGYTWGGTEGLGAKGMFAQLNDFLDTVIGLIWKGEDFWDGGDNTHLKENLRKLACILYDQAGEEILPKTITEKTPEEIHNMDAEELVCYVVTGFIEKEFDYFKFDKEFRTLEELACYVLIELAADIIPFQSYKAQIDNGQKTAGLSFALDIAADIGVYYLNAYTTMNLQYGIGFEKTLAAIEKWALKVDNYGGFFSTCRVDSNNITDPFDVLDKTVFRMIPLSLFGVTTSRDFIMDRIVGAVLDLDFDSLFSLFYKTESSPFHKTAYNFIIWLANSILSVVCAGRTIIPSSVGGVALTTVESLISKYGIAEMVVNLIYGLYDQGADVLRSAVNLVSPLMGLEDDISWLEKDVAPAGYPNKTIDQLKQYTIECAEMTGLPNDRFSLNLDDWNYKTDYDLYTYRYYDSAIDDAKDYIIKYEAWQTLYNQGKTDVPPAVDQTKVNDLYATIEKYLGRLEQREATTAQLYYVIEKINEQGYKAANYPKQVWDVFTKAKKFALAVNDIPIYDPEDEDEEFPIAKQSMINEARKNLIIAWKILDNPIADYTALEAIIDRVEKMDLSKYTEESANLLREAIRYAKEDFSWVLSKDDEDKVTDLVKKIQLIIDNLVEAIVDSDIIPIVEGVVVDKVSGMIQGLEEGLDVDGLLAMIGTSHGGEVRVTNPMGFDTMGTGTTVELINNGQVTQSFEIVIFGDLSSDGVVSEEDFTIVDLYNSWAIDLDPDGCYFKAGDLNDDFSVDEQDLTTIDLVNAWAGMIDQKNHTELIRW